MEQSTPSAARAAKCVFESARFKVVEFDHFKMQDGLSSFVIEQSIRKAN